MSELKEEVYQRYYTSTMDLIVNTDEELGDYVYVPWDKLSDTQSKLAQSIIMDAIFESIEDICRGATYTYADVVTLAKPLFYAEIENFITEPEREYAMTMFINEKHTFTTRFLVTAPNTAAAIVRAGQALKDQGIKSYGVETCEIFMPF